MANISNTQMSNLNKNEHKKLRTRTPLDENKKLELRRAAFDKIEKRLDEIEKQYSENMEIFAKIFDDFEKRLDDYDKKN